MPSILTRPATQLRYAVHQHRDITMRPDMFYMIMVRDVYKLCPDEGDRLEQAHMIDRTEKIPPIPSILRYRVRYRRSERGQILYKTATALVRSAVGS